MTSNFKFFPINDWVKQESSSGKQHWEVQNCGEHWATSMEANDYEKHIPSSWSKRESWDKERRVKADMASYAMLRVYHPLAELRGTGSVSYCTLFSGLFGFGNIYTYIMIYPWCGPLQLNVKFIYMTHTFYISSLQVILNNYLKQFCFETKFHGLRFFYFLAWCFHTEILRLYITKIFNFSND